MLYYSQRLICIYRFDIENLSSLCDKCKSMVVCNILYYDNQYMQLKKGKS